MSDEIPAPPEVVEAATKETKPESGESETPFRTGKATWKNKDHDEEVIITGSRGKGPDDREYVSVEGSDTGIPIDEIDWPKPEEGSLGANEPNSPVDAEASSETPPTKPTETNNLSPERKVAQKLLNARTEQLKTDKASGKITYDDMNAGDKALYSAYSFRGALSEGRGTSIDKKPDGTIEGVVMKVGDQEYTVVSIADGRADENGKRVYSGKAKDPTDPTKTIDIVGNISGEALADAYSKKHADEIAINFPEGAERDLITWHAKGGETDLSPAATEFAAKESNPFQKVNEAISDQITLIEASLATEGLTPEQKKNTEAILSELKLAEHTNGDVGKLLKLDSLTRSMGLSGEFVAQNIKGVLDEISSTVDRDTLIDKFLNDSDLSEDQQKRFKDLGAKENGVFELLNDPEFRSLKNIDIALFGKELSIPEAATVDKLIQDFANTHMTEAQRNLLAEYSKKGGMGALWILAILLAIPAAAALGAIEVAAGSAKKR